MSWVDITDSVCPIARALSVVGDRWTLLLLREFAMGVNRFDELQAQTSMSSHLLTTRLRRMESDGVIERRPYSDHPVRCEYHATPKGKELHRVLMLFLAWGRKWEGDIPHGEPAFSFQHRVTGARIETIWDAPHNGQEFTFDDVVACIGPTFQQERLSRTAAFRNASRSSRQ